MKHFRSVISTDTGITIFTKINITVFSFPCSPIVQLTFQLLDMISSWYRWLVAEWYIHSALERSGNWIECTIINPWYYWGSRCCSCAHTWQTECFLGLVLSLSRFLVVFVHPCVHNHLLEHVVWHRVFVDILKVSSIKFVRIGH